MKKSIFTIESNEKLAQDVYKMTLRGDTGDITAPGQFVNIELECLYLRRPISVCDLEDSVLSLIYKVVGKGTAHMSSMGKGDTLDLLTGLGNGYDTSKSGNTPLLIGGGVGVPQPGRARRNDDGKPDADDGDDGTGDHRWEEVQQPGEDA